MGSLTSSRALKRLDLVSARVVSDYPYGAAGADQRHRATDVSD